MTGPPLSVGEEVSGPGEDGSSTSAAEVKKAPFAVPNGKWRRNARIRGWLARHKVALR